MTGLATFSHRLVKILLYLVVVREEEKGQFNATQTKLLHTKYLISWRKKVPTNLLAIFDLCLTNEKVGMCQNCQLEWLVENHITL